MGMHAPVAGGDEDEILGKAYDGRIVRRLVPYLKPYRLIILVSLVLLLFSSAMDLAGPYLTKVAIDHNIAPANGKPTMSGLPLILGALSGVADAGLCAEVHHELHAAVGRPAHHVRHAHPPF